MFWRTLTIVTACLIITMIALHKIFGDTYLAIAGVVIIFVDFCVWVYRFVDRFGSK